MANTTPTPPTPAAAPAAPAHNNPNPAPATPAAGHAPTPPAPMTWEGALERILAVAAAAAGSLLGDWLPALIIVTLVLGPFLHPRTRPLAMGFLRWLHGRGVDVAAMLDRIYGYDVPTKLKSWLWTAIAAAALGWFAQMLGTVFMGRFSGIAVLFFTMATAIAGALFAGALVSIAKTRDVPNRRDIQRALANPQAFNNFLQRFGTPSSPAFALGALFTGATLLGIAHGYYIAAAGPESVAFRVYGAAVGLGTAIGAGVAFQIVIYAITKLGAMAFAFFARPVVAVGREGLIAAVPGLTHDNADEVLGVATSFNGLVAYTPYVLAVGALGLAHVVMGMVFPVSVLLLLSGLTMIVVVGMYLGHAINSPWFGNVFAGGLSAFFVGGVVWSNGGKGYWTTLSGFSVLHGLAFMATLVAVCLIAAFVGWAVRKAAMMCVPGTRFVSVGGGPYREGAVAVAVPSPWPTRFGWMASVFALLLISPILFGWLNGVMHPRPPTPMERHAQERLAQASEHNIERTAEGLARRIERTADDFVNPPPAEYNPPPSPPEEPRRRGHRHRQAADSAAACTRYSGSGPCSGMCQSYVRANPRRCGTN